jgi:hypothetical protein
VTTTPTARCRELLLAGRRGEAELAVAELIAHQFGLSVIRVSIGADWTSLNSVNGIVDAAGGDRWFFKFHQEEGEEATVREYYRAGILQRAGLPVDVPVRVSREPGHQMLLYAFRHDRRLADVCLECERSEDDTLLREIVALEGDLDRRVGRSYLATLHASDAAQSTAEAIHQLFHHRLRTASDPRHLAGRFARFYGSQVVRLPGNDLPWAEFGTLRWRINGVSYRHTIAELFEESLIRLDPVTLGASGAVTAHGDAHNANVWLEERGERPRLVLFDPAFAGDHVPALLAEVKATFHNVFAHRLWLYHPNDAESLFDVDVAVKDGWLDIRHDWALTPLRQALLSSKIENVWKPLLAALRDHALLPGDWERIVRCALFCCPTLVTNLRAGESQGPIPGRSPAMSALSFALALVAGSEPQDNGDDPLTRFITAISPVS